ncbi:MAG: hypothetical protein WEA81_05730, partial [Dehalococcoidia bacterium]
NGGARFAVVGITQDSITILIGPQETRQPISRALLEEVLSQIPQDGWLPVGAAHTTASPDGTLEALLKPALHRSTASYVTALFAKAGLVELDTTGTHRVRRI